MNWIDTRSKGQRFYTPSFLLGIVSDNFSNLLVSSFPRRRLCTIFEAFTITTTIKEGKNSDFRGTFRHYSTCITRNSYLLRSIYKLHSLKYSFLQSTNIQKGGGFVGVPWVIRLTTTLTSLLGTWVVPWTMIIYVPCKINNNNHNKVTVNSSLIVRFSRIVLFQRDLF